MARSKAAQPNIDLSDPAYLQGRTKDNTGTGDGTPVNEFIYGDLHQMLAKLMALAGVVYNDLPDNEDNGYQLIDAVQHLPSKNDFVLNISENAGKLQVPLKLGLLKNNEVFICKASVAKAAQTQIRGTLDNVSKSVTFVGDFQTDEYVRLINTASGVTLIRMVDAFNLDVVTETFNYLKAATEPEVIAGIINTKAVTPETFLAAFAEYVLGDTSDNFLADENRNGLLSKEDKAIINNIGASRIKNVGSFSGFDVNSGSPGTSYVVSGDINSATLSSRLDNGQVITVVFANAMNNTDYKIDVSVQSLGSFRYDNDITPVVWKPISTTSAQIYVEETGSVTQNLKIHLDVIQL